ncbi:MAG TPA: trypsin-like peptidase domain-containing protein [Myxococcota bacterium]|nr:trypsin-like peptidase domain-containing protein [Myxococcota bacterium]
MSKAALATLAGGLLALATLVGATVAAPACALVVVSDRGFENVTAPSDDPGWANVGTVSGLTGIYLGNGWMLTASHVGAGPVVLGGRTFSAVPDSTVQLRNQDGSLADLILFRIQGAPHLPRLQIATATPQVGTPVVLMGHGRNRGAPISWSGHEGFAWGTASALRWGTNTVFKSDVRANSTEAFVTQFRKDGATPHEAQAAVGDSGGAVFVKVRRKWRLAGVLDMVATFDKQPPETALYGNFTVSADLARYRPQIEKLTSKPMERSPVKSKEGRPR